MKIENVELYTNYIVETDDGSFYRRNGSYCWEKRYGESWETVYLDEEDRIESAWLEYMKEIHSEDADDYQESCDTMTLMDILECIKSEIADEGTRALVQELVLRAHESGRKKGKNESED